MMDRMGLGVVHHVAKLLGETTRTPRSLDDARYLDEQFIQKGHLGVASGRGLLLLPEPSLRPARVHLNGGAGPRGRGRPTTRAGQLTHRGGSTSDSRTGSSVSPLLL